MKGARVALTQSEGRLEGLEAALRERGYKVVRNPLITTDPVFSSDTRDRARDLLECAWVLFTSPSAVEAWRALNLPFRGLSVRIGAVGDKTAEAVQRYGGRIVLVGESSTAAGLARTFLEHPKAKAPVGLPCGDRALTTLQEELEKSGYDTRRVVIYRTRTLDWHAGDVDIVVLASPSAVAALPEAAARGAKLVALGPTTAQAVVEAGWPHEQAREPTAAAVLEVIERLVTA